MLPHPGQGQVEADGDVTAQATGHQRGQQGATPCRQIVLGAGERVIAEQRARLGQMAMQAQIGSLVHMAEEQPLRWHAPVGEEGGQRLDVGSALGVKQDQRAGLLRRCGGGLHQSARLPLDDALVADLDRRRAHCSAGLTRPDG